MVSFEKIQSWQKQVSNKALDTNRLFKLTKIVHGIKTKRILVKGDKGNMKEEVIRSEYSLKEFKNDLQSFTSNTNAVLCPSHIITALELLEVK